MPALIAEIVSIMFIRTTFLDSGEFMRPYLLGIGLHKKHLNTV